MREEPRDKGSCSISTNRCTSSSVEPSRQLLKGCGRSMSVTGRAIVVVEVVRLWVSEQSGPERSNCARDGGGCALYETPFESSDELRSASAREECTQSRASSADRRPNEIRECERPVGVLRIASAPLPPVNEAGLRVTHFDEKRSTEPPVHFGEPLKGLVVERVSHDTQLEIRDGAIQNAKT